MPAVTIRNLSEATHRALKVRAAHHGRSTEAEMREILESAIRPQARQRAGRAKPPPRPHQRGRRRPRRDAGPRAGRADGLGMILLDTNVVCEAMKPEPAAAVIAWLDDQVAETAFLSSVIIAGLMSGIGALPDGRRKQGLAEALDGVMEISEGRILPFDVAAARRYADLAVEARAAGRTAISPPSPPRTALPSPRAAKARLTRRALP